METPANLNIRAIQHIGIPITNVVASAAFYGKLGFSKAMEKPFLHNGEQGVCVMMKRGDIIMELYQMPASVLPEIASRKDGHVDHVAFDVADIDATYATLQQAGFNILEPEPVFLQFWENGCKYFNITGPDGERLEFNQVL
ncbi:MAG: VOC family protein [Bacteroidota bacterium]